MIITLFAMFLARYQYVLIMIFVAYVYSDVAKLENEFLASGVINVYERKIDV